MKLLKKTTAFIFIIIAATLLAYFNSFNNAFIWDDQALVVENRAIQVANVRNIISYFSDSHATTSREQLSTQIWRPIATTSYMLDYSLWQLNPYWYHVENTLLHACNAVLVFIITSIIIGNSFTALLAALVFSLHPAQTQAVTWISGRSNVLFLLFFLLSFLLHIRNRKIKKSDLDYGLCIIFFTLSLLSKEMAITLPLICILYDIYYVPNKSLRDYTYYYFYFFLIEFFYLLARYSVLGRIGQWSVFTGIACPVVLFTMLKAIAGYVRIIFIPVNLRAEYLIDISRSIFEAPVLAALLIFLGLGIIYYVFRRQKSVSFYIAWFFITLIPVYNIIPMNTIMGERFLYLPLVAFASLFGTAFLYLSNRFATNAILKKFIIFLWLVILILYGTGTVLRNNEMRDELTFCAKEIERSPNNAIFYYNLGNAYIRKKCFALAVQEYKKSLSLKPDNQWAYINLADAYRNMGLYDQAIENYKKAIAIPGRDKYTSAAYIGLEMSYRNKAINNKATTTIKKQNVSN